MANAEEMMPVIHHIMRVKGLNHELTAPAAVLAEEYLNRKSKDGTYKLDDFIRAKLKGKNRRRMRWARSS